MTEKEFYNKIDCNFPYYNLDNQIELVKEAITISDKSVFAVLHELARIPTSKENSVNHKFLNQTLDYIDTNFNHPLKQIILKLSKRMKLNEEIDITETLGIMNEIEKHYGMYDALNIAYFASEDLEGKIEKRYEEIIESWKNKTQPNTK